MDAVRLLASNVRRLRTERGLTQEQAAAAADGMHPTYWSEVETGKRNPSVTVVARMAKGLGVTLAQLFEEGAT